MKYVRYLCLMTALVFLLPVVGLAASETSLHEQFTTADAAALNQLYLEKPDAFITELAKEERSVIQETAQKLFSAQTDTDAYYTELFLLGVSKDWSKDERYVLRALFDCDGSKFIKWITESCPVGDKISYEAFFKGHQLFSGAYATAHNIRLGTLLHQNPKRFVQELAKLDSETQNACSAVFNEMTDEKASETLAALLALRTKEQWSPAEDQVIGKLIEDAEKNFVPPKTADVGVGEHLFTVLAVSLLSLCACVMLMWKVPKRK